MRPNKAKEKLLAGKATLAISLGFVNAGLAEFLGQIGYDIIVMDGEHGAMVDTDVEDLARACDAAGVASMLRMPFNGPLVQRYLDMGITGIHVPQVQSGAQVREIVEAVKYRPLGQRGLGTYRATAFGINLGSWPEYIEKANAATMIKVSIEDAEGVAALPEIVKVPGLDIVSLGTTDMSDSMGYTGQPKHPKVLEAVENAVQIIKASGKVLGLPARTPSEIKEAHERGARFMFINTTRLLVDSSRSYLDVMREFN